MTHPKTLVAWLEKFFLASDIAADLIGTAVNIALRTFTIYGNLRLATKEEDERITSPHTSSSHNTDEQKYIPVRDTRFQQTPIVLIPIETDGELVAYEPCLEVDKLASTALAEPFAKEYSKKALKRLKTFDAWCAFHIGRSDRDDRCNNRRSRESIKKSRRDEFARLAPVFLAMNDDDWQRASESMQDLSKRNAAFCEYIEETRIVRKAETQQ